MEICTLMTRPLHYALPVIKHCLGSIRLIVVGVGRGWCGGDGGGDNKINFIVIYFYKTVDKFYKVVYNAFKGGITMGTRFAKICRILRIEHGEVLRDMAQKLGVSSSYLSAVENGKRPIPKSWGHQIINLYDLPQDEASNLSEAILLDSQEVVLDLRKFDDDAKDLLIAFARKCDNYDKINKISLRDMFNNKD